MLKQNPNKGVSKASLHLALLLVLLLAMAALSEMTAPVAHAATITVNSTTNTVANDGFCTLREAITAAKTNTASGPAAGECPPGIGADNIELSANLTYTLDEVDNINSGNNGLPLITTEITISGNGATVERSSLPATPQFRIINVASSGILVLIDITLKNGDAGSGSGGAIRTDGSVSISNSSITQSVGNSGGGIQNEASGRVEISDSTVSSNTASVAGSISNLGTMDIKNSTVSGNADGFGIDNFSTLALTNVTISGNSRGGGISNFGALTLTNSTVSGNSATFGGINGGAAGIRNGGTAELVNTIVAANLSGGDCSGAAVISLGHNLDSDGTCNLTATGDHPNADPLLAGC